MKKMIHQRFIVLFTGKIFWLLVKLDQTHWIQLDWKYPLSVLKEQPILDIIFSINFSESNIFAFFWTKASMTVFLFSETISKNFPFPNFRTTFSSWSSVPIALIILSALWKVSCIFSKCTNWQLFCEFNIHFNGLRSFFDLE